MGGGRLQSSACIPRECDFAVGASDMWNVVNLCQADGVDRDQGICY